MNIQKLSTHFQNIDIDYLYHLGLDSSMDLPSMFGDIKYVILTRSNGDADYVASQLTQKYYKLDNIEIECHTIAKDERYHIHKISNTLVISHGIGSPSLLICINEVIKLLWHAKVYDASFFRIGPCGGIGIGKGQLICSNEAVNHNFAAQWENIEFGEARQHISKTSDKLLNKIMSDNTNIHKGKILSTNSFYNGQGRINGAIEVSYSQEESDKYLLDAYKSGVRAIDLESGCFLAICNEFEIPAAIVLESIVDRLDGTQDIDYINHSDLVSKPNSNIKNAALLAINYIIKN